MGWCRATRHRGSAGGESHQVNRGGRIDRGRAQTIAHVLGRDLLALPVHPGRLPVIDLHPVHPDVTFAGLRVARDHAGQRDERSAIVRPGLEDRDAGEIDVGSAQNDLLAGRVLRRDQLGEEGSNLCEFRQHLQLIDETCGGLRLQEHTDAVSDGVQGVGFEREVHAAIASELIHQHTRLRVTLDVLEEQGRASGLCGAAAELCGTVGDLRHLEDGIDLEGNPLQLSCFVQRIDPFAQIVVSQFPLLPQSGAVRFLW